MDGNVETTEALSIPIVIETVQCDLRGFEEVEVDVNVMASDDELNQLASKMRNGGEQNVIGSIRNWPTAFGDGPFSKSSPVVFTAWLAQKAVSIALAQYINDPNSLTA